MGCHRYTCRTKINTFWNNNKKWFPFVCLQTQHVPMKNLCQFMSYLFFVKQSAIRGIQHFGCNYLDRIVRLHPFSSATVWQQCVFSPAAERLRTANCLVKTKDCSLTHWTRLNRLTSQVGHNCIASLNCLPCSLARRRVWPRKLKRDGIRVKHFSLGWALFDFK